MSEPIITKQCTKCKQTKPLAQFNKDKQRKDGLSYACKDCLSKEARFRYKYCGGAEKKRQYQQTDAYKKNHKKHYQKWYKSKGRQYNKEYSRQYRKTKKGKIKTANNCQNWRKTKGKQYFRGAYQKNPNQFKAYRAIQKAVKNGDIPSPKLLKCTYCDNKAYHYHHVSYEPEHWLVVIPVCAMCHKAIHKKLSLSG